MRGKEGIISKFPVWQLFTPGKAAVRLLEQKLIKKKKKACNFLADKTEFRTATAAEKGNR